jgi:CrcB protein
MDRYLLVFLGGGVGSLLRFQVGRWSTQAFGLNWPYGTFTVNIVGGLFMGLLAGFLAHRGGVDQDRWRVLLGVGVLGGFTTFSAFSLEVALMIERRVYGQAAAYVAASVLLAVAALFVGLLTARRLFA